MNDNRSVAMIDGPQFINLEQDAINPGISKCEVKVLYLGKNRNGSFITKDVAIQMANSLPGTPIVGAFRKDIEDFGDHGHIMHIEDGEIEFSCKTIPYGFVALDAPVWFQMFKDIDEFGNEVEREYLMTTGYLWTGQFPETESVITEGKGQSMELDPETMDGHWATDSKDDIEFFIINDAIFTKLCILGDDVEPCFEGASVTKPEVSKNFTKDAEFSQTLFAMLNELKFALNDEGGSSMSQTENQTEEVVEEAPATEDFAAEEEGIETQESAGEEFAAEEEDEDPKEDESEDEADDDDQKRTEHSVVEEEASISSEEFAALKQELEELKAYKLAQENAQKDAMINKYFMLDEADKADVIAHKEEYTLDEIESQLALIYVKKNVDFSTIDGAVEESQEEDDPITTFSLDSEVAGIVPPMVAVLRETVNE